MLWNTIKQLRSNELDVHTAMWKDLISMMLSEKVRSRLRSIALKKIKNIN